MYDFIMNRESLKQHCEKTCKRFKHVFESGVYREHRLVLDLLEQTEWIPVSERLPEVAQRVIFCRKNNEICIGTLHTYENDLAITLEPTGIRYVYSLDSVNAWMPLPKPYKAESEE